jgi:hypothetical protein
MVVGVSLSAVGESVDGSHLSLPPYYAVNHTEAVGITLLTPGESGDGSLIPPVYVTLSDTTKEMSFRWLLVASLAARTVPNSPMPAQ